MKILQITKKFPYPRRDGEAWAVLGLAEGLKHAGCQIDLFSLNTDQHLADREIVEALKRTDLYNNIHTFDISVKSRQIPALFNLLQNQSFHEARFSSMGAEDKINALANQYNYDVILADSIFTVLYLKGIKEVLPHAKIIIRAHNVEYLIWERYSERLSGIKKWYFRLQSRRLKRMETDLILLGDGLLTVSDIDKNIFQQICPQDKPIINIPIGMNLIPSSKIDDDDRPYIIGFIGSLDWRPNLEGLDFFIKNVWPVILDGSIDVVLMIAGRNAKNISKYKHVEHVSFLGEIDDSNAFIGQIDAMIVPLWSGSGTRVKVLQALSIGTPIIATSLALEGLEVTDHKEVLVANNTQEWISSLSQLKEDQHLPPFLVKNGKAYIENKHNIETIGRATTQFIEHL